MDLSEYVLTPSDEGVGKAVGRALKTSVTNRLPFQGESPETHNAVPKAVAATMVQLAGNRYTGATITTARVAAETGGHRPDLTYGPSHPHQGRCRQSKESPSCGERRLFPPAA